MGTLTRPVTVAAVALILIGGIVAFVAAEVGISAFLAFGQDLPEVTEYAESALGRDVFERAGRGHDGKYFFVMASDPWLAEPAVNAALMDRPAYRSQRMLYPMLASGFGTLPTTWLPWTLALTNVAAIAAGTWASAVYAGRQGGSPWWGLGFALNVGLLFEVIVGGGGAVAFAFGMWAITSADRGDLVAAALYGAAAVLTREAMLVVPLGLVLFVWLRSRRVPWSLALGPMAAAVSWGAFVRVRLSGLVDGAQVLEFGIPFGGLIRAIPEWLESPIDLLAGVATMLVVASSMRRLSRTAGAISWGTVGFAFLALLLAERVWLRAFDLTRAVAPLITAFVLAEFASDPQRASQLRTSDDE